MCLVIRGKIKLPRYADSHRETLQDPGAESVHREPPPAVVILPVLANIPSLPGRDRIQVMSLKKDTEMKCAMWHSKIYLSL